MNCSVFDDKKLKLAVDLGTTTIDACLTDSCGNVLASSSFKNKQSVYGSDVINRINSANNNVDYNGEIKKISSLMKEMFITDVTKSINKMLSEISGKNSDIDLMCVCGNTTMISILLDYNMDSMGKYPFETILKESIATNTKIVFGDDFIISAPLLLSGCASAFIGGDILSGIYYIENHLLKDSSDNYLFIDLGTNGEMVLRNNNKYFATSAACGPAFEGCVRKQSVYGSTLLDAISMGVKTKNISREGIIREPFFEKGIDISNVHIDMEILRNIILAKSAIVTGIIYLVKESGLAIENINNIFIAGGFGFHINIDNAIYLGVFPKWFAGKVTVCGNTSLKGACEIIKNKEDICVIDKSDINILQLTMLDEYQDELVKHMCFS